MLPLRNPFRIWSLLYGSGVTIRNKMFDNGMLKSVAFDVPVIGVGNLRVGGTGKTPCVEWLLEHLQTQYKPAVLSRGYGRRTKGFRWVNVEDDARNCGDEPLQIKKKFSNIPIAVCEDRVVGITQLLAESEADLVILDDAFQHRYVKPTYNIVLSAFHQPFFKDELLPMGRLREQPKHLSRADCVIYTKCPDDWKEKRERYIEEVKHYAPNALVGFSRIGYGDVKPLFAHALDKIKQDVLLVTGLADAKPLVEHLKEKYNIVRHYDYPDHYDFFSSDIKNWKQELQRHEFPTVIFTTEKDAVRMLEQKGLVEELPIYIVPMKMEMIEGEQELLKQLSGLKVAAD